MERNYIYELLQKHSRVIIPNFGAFLIKDKAKINSAEANQDITISFNDFLKFNDGILIDYIAQKQTINKLQAGNIVNEYISEIKSNLKDNGFFIIEGVGKLFTDDKDVIRFTQQIEEGEIVDKKKEKISKKEHVEIKPSSDGVLPKEVIIPKKEEKKEQKPIPEKKEETKTFTKAEVPERHKEVEISEGSNSSTKGKWIFSIILFVVIIIAGLYLAGFFNVNNHIADNSNDNTEVKTDNTETVNETPAVGIAADSVADTDSEIIENDTTAGTEDTTESKIEESDIAESNVELESETIESETPKYFHLIAASCNSKKAADKYVSKLKAQGYDSKIINEKNGHFRVSYGSYETKDAALKELEVLKSKKKSAWYLYYPLD